MQELKEFLPVISVLISAIGCLVGIYRVVKSAEEKIDSQLKSINDDIDRKFATIWRRFDERKVTVDGKFEKAEEKAAKTFVRLETYEMNHHHMQEMIKNQFEALSILLDERLKNLTTSIDEIKKCRAEGKV